MLHGALYIQPPPLFCACRTGLTLRRIVVRLAMRTWLRLSDTAEDVMMHTRIMRHTARRDDG